jgi:hypothetical protein
MRREWEREHRPPLQWDPGSEEAQAECDVNIGRENVSRIACETEDCRRNFLQHNEDAVNASPDAGRKSSMVI